MKQIPSVDLRDFLSDNTNKRQDFIKNIGKAYEDIGFVALKGHFLDNDLSMSFTHKFVNFLVFLMKPSPSMKSKGLLANEVILPLVKSTPKGEPQEI